MNRTDGIGRMRISIHWHYLLIVVVLLGACSDKNMGPDGNPAAPVASFTVSPSTGDVVDTFSFDASASSDDADAIDLLQVRWDWEGDGTWDTAYSTGKTATHQYLAAGSYEAALQVKDSDNLTGRVSRTVTVTQNISSILVSPATADVDNGFTQQFVAAGSDGNGNPVTVAVSWSTSSDSLGNVDSQGLFTAGVYAPFSGTLTASSGGLEGTADVSILPADISFSSDLLPTFQQVCGTCHGSSGGLSLVSYTGLMAGDSNNGPVVTPGDPENSVLIQKLSSNPPFGSQMPQSGSVTESWINKLWLWISQGAVNN